MNGFLISSKNTSELTSAEPTRPGPGYGILRFLVPEEWDWQRAQSEFARLYTPILSAYYEITQYRNTLLEHHVDAFNAASELVAPRAGLSLRRRVMRVFSLRSRVERVLDILLQNQSVSLDLKKFAAEKRKDNVIDDHSPFNFFIDEILNDEFTIPAQEIRNIIQIVEDRRLKYFENASILVAGLAGGVLGSLLTYFMTAGGRPH